MTIALDTISFLVTPAGGRKHLAQCPHLVGATSSRPLLAGEEVELCDWCGKELSGHGRTYFDDLDAALAALRLRWRTGG